MPRWIDLHLDLAWNALYFDRDLTEPVELINSREACMTDSRARGHATVAFPEMRRGNLAVCLATLVVHARPDLRPIEGHKRISLDYRSPTAACAIAQGQLAYYRLLEQQEELRILTSRDEFAACWAHCSSIQRPSVDRPVPIGVIIAMEGADGIVSPSQVAEWFERGLRVIGPVHYGHNEYAHGTGESGELTRRGVELLRAMERLGIILDVTHLSDPSFFQALDVFAGPVIASHQNCRSLASGDRQFSDEQLRLLIHRGAIIGSSFDNWMIVPNWSADRTPRSDVTLEKLADHIDHICQLAGSHEHVALGTDLDGGYGTEQCPAEISTIADVQKLAAVFERRGFSTPAINAVFHDNARRFFTQQLP